MKKKSKRSRLAYLRSKYENKNENPENTYNNLKRKPKKNKIEVYNYTSNV